MEPYLYQTIDLSYLKEISMGDTGYELEMAGKFVEIISDEMVQLTACFTKGDDIALKRTVHKMRSTIYLMGLRPKLNAAIEAIEYENLSVDQLKIHIATIMSVCGKAKEEVLLFLDRSK